MPILPERKDLSTVSRNVRTNLETRLAVKLGEDSKLRALSDALSAEIVTAYNEQRNYIESRFVTSAQGQNLIDLALENKVDIRPSTFASCSKYTQNQMFYVDSGTFGDLNGGNSFTIPKGTLISSNPLKNDLNVLIEYRVKEDVICVSGNSNVFASIEAVNAGSSSNVSSNILIRHGFTGVSGWASLKTINFYPILNGRDKESDESLRYRISQSYTSKIGRSEITAQLLSLDVPGVLSTKLLPGYYGIGTNALVVLGADYRVTSDVLDQVQFKINSLSLPALRVVAIPANSVSIDIEIDMDLMKSMTQSEKNGFESNVNIGLLRFIRGRGLGSSIDVDELKKEFLRLAKSNILKSNRGNTKLEVFKKIYIVRGSNKNNTSMRELFIGKTIRVEEDEYLDLGTITFKYS